MARLRACGQSQCPRLNNVGADRLARIGAGLLGKGRCASRPVQQEPVGELDPVERWFEVDDVMAKVTAELCHLVQRCACLRRDR